MSTVKYVAVQAAARDITDFDQSPLHNNSSYLALFIIVYMIVGDLFIMNLFVGFIVDGFNLQKGSSQKVGALVIAAKPRCLDGLAITRRFYVLGALKRHIL